MIQPDPAIYLGMFGSSRAILKPYVGLDGGYVASHAAGLPRGVLIGAATGVGLSLAPFNFDLFAGYRLRAPDFLGREKIGFFGRMGVIL